MKRRSRAGGKADNYERGTGANTDLAALVHTLSQIANCNLSVSSCILLCRERRCRENLSGLYSAPFLAA
jgi:hypothetical protein